MADAAMPTGSAPASIATSPFRAPTQLPRSNSRNRSPPMAFAKTPNDALVPLISPPDRHDHDPLSAMSPMSIPGASDLGLSHYQTVIDKQAAAIDSLHIAFAAERQAWTTERRQLYQRISNLERLLRAQNGHSPAKSPVISPNGILASPQARATSAHRLPSIAEDENIRPLSERRANAPQSIGIPTFETVEELDENNNRHSLLLESAAAQIDELSVSPPQSAKKFSPPLEEGSALTGHAFAKNLNRPPTPPPRNMTLIGVEDTPTRHNTHINTLLTQTSDEEEEAMLAGPLNMPELPGQPTADNFTEEMLFKKLELIAQDPQHNKPTVFTSPSPGLAMPEGEDPGAGLSPKTLASESFENPLAPVPTRDQTAMTPFGQLDNNAPLADGPSADERTFAQGGIRLKKKPSSNFGAPFGQLGGFAGLRKLS